MIHSVMRGGLAVLATAMFATSVSAQTIDPQLQASWDYMQQAMPGVPYSVLEAACGEGTVMLYHGTWVDAQMEQIAGFNQHFPCIKVETYSVTMGELRERFLAEQRAGRFVTDIIQDSDVSSLDEHIDEGLLMQYTIANAGAFAPENTHPNYWYPLRTALVGIAWNTDLVTDEEASVLGDWKGMIDPRWAGRAGITDPGDKGVAYQHWFSLHQMYGEDFLRQIGELHPRILSGAANAMASLASGDVAIVFNASETGLLPLLAKGAPVKWTLPSPGVGPLTGQAIVASAPHPNAAKLYQEYAFTQEGYGLWNRTGGAPATDAYPDQRDVAKEPWYKLPETLFALDPDKADADFDALMASFHEFIGASR